MSVHLKREIENLKNLLLKLGTLVEENTSRAVEALEKRDKKLAESAIEADMQIDEMEVEVEEECLKILALHQPVAVDLRFIVAVLKINSDLERIGDLAVNIAERASYLAVEKESTFPMDFSRMSELAHSMLRNALDSLVNLDMDLAGKVGGTDDEVDDINKQMYEQVKMGLRETPDQIEQLIHLLCVSRHIERIADHATNIAEDVLYMGKGEIMRHRREYYDG